MDSRFCMFNSTSALSGEGIRKHDIIRNMYFKLSSGSYDSNLGLINGKLMDYCIFNIYVFAQVMCFKDETSCKIYIIE